MSKADDLRAMRERRFMGAKAAKPKQAAGAGSVPRIVAQGRIGKDVGDARHPGGSHALGTQDDQNSMEGSARKNMRRGAPAVHKPKVGRPLNRDKDKTLAALKPWEVEGVSRATWFRWKAKKDG